MAENPYGKSARKLTDVEKKALADFRRRVDDGAFTESAILGLAKEQDRLDRVRDALAHLFPDLAKPTEAKYLADYARIALYLMTPCADFGPVPAVEAACDAARAALVADYRNGRASPTSPKRHLDEAELKKVVSVSKLIRRVMKAIGFSDTPGVYFVGDAGAAFGAAVGNKILFVDGISARHGEFSHSIQWMYVHFHFAGQKPPLNNRVADLYARSITYASDVLQAAEAGGNPVGKTATVWDFCVDCFRNIEGGVEQQYDLVGTRFSGGMRAPGNLQDALVGGRLRATVLGGLLGARYDRLQFRGTSLAEAMEDKSSILQDFYKERAKDNTRNATQPKPMVQFPNASGAIIRDPLPPGAAQTAVSSKQWDKLAAAGGGLLSGRELQEMNDRLAKEGPKQAGATPPNDLDGLWLRVHYPSQVANNNNQ